MKSPSDGSNTLLRDERHGGVVLTLNRPERRNAFDWSMVENLHRELDQIEDDPHPPRFVMITGAGGAFCSGADLNMRATMNPTERYRHSRLVSSALARVAKLPMPTVAVIDGPAYGGGCELTLACDLRLASDRAVLGLTETKIGSFPGAGGTQRLARLVGTSRAKEIIFLALPLSADAASRMGLVNQVVPADELHSRATGIARTIASRAPLAVAAAKRAIDDGADNQLETGLALESQLIKPLFSTRDYDEGTRAFAEKRDPAFKGE